tara:strand:- start:540 stop:761 length:222 start_codon:yes stop_codon:yes gene_type:complete
MLNWIYGNYFYVYEIMEMIDEIETKRQLRRIDGSTMSSTFSQDLKDKLNGVRIINEEKEEEDKVDEESKITMI